MNTGRVLFALNSEDPDIVAQGLEEFRGQILKDHDALESFGYCGRGLSKSSIQAFKSHCKYTVSGVLAGLLKASPRLEEFFILWDLPGRDDDKRLSAAHMSSMAAILHCARSDNTLCTAIVNRILHEHTRSITNQLSSGDLSLVHSTLALILAMCRSSTQNCRDTFHKLLVTSPNTYATLLQQGKTISWEPPSSDSNDAGEEVRTSKVKTDSRLLLAFIVLTVLDNADQSICSELLSSLPNAGAPLLRRVTNAIHKDISASAHLILEVLMHIRNEKPQIEHSIGTRLVDAKFLSNLLAMYDSEDEKVQQLASRFLLDHCRHLAVILARGGSAHAGAGGFARANAIQILRALEAQRDLRHREVIRLLAVQYYDYPEGVPLNQ
jgi:Ribosome 60S biogenesis N-terminal